jgi:hypothetical protein
MKNLNAKIQSFAGDVAGEAKQVFGDVSGLFNSITGSLSSIVKAGATQQGFGAAETNAINAQIEDQAAVNYRNEKSAVGNAVAAIGGGNAVNPSGLETAVNLQTAQAVEQQKSQQQQQATIANYETGRENYFKAIQADESAPNMFNTVSDFNKTAQSGYDTAEKSQSAIDSANNWWQPLVMGGINAGASFLTGGLSGLSSGSGFMSGASKGLSTDVSKNGI